MTDPTHEERNALEIVIAKVWKGSERAPSDADMADAILHAGFRLLFQTNGGQTQR